MRHVARFVPLAQANGGAEIVLHDAEMVAVVADVGGKLGTVAPADDALLAARRGLPVHFQLQLVGLDEARGVGEPLPELAEEEQETMGLGLIVAQGAVGGGPRAPRDCPLRQGDGPTGIPGLRGGGSGDQERRHHAEQEGASVHTSSTPLPHR
ncbi:MAG: hypothetical protein AUH12_08220 [Gemmatimonadetes bacterium 13_2_20CM_69_8]|nr:MAG: hypothetical protein AUH12_08220 [Gemmatimonadetes bacterium 13_2_20CM_69_8]